MSRLFRKPGDGVASVATPLERDFSQRPRTLIVGFVLLHAVFLLALLPSFLGGIAIGDLSLYRAWVETSLTTGLWRGIQIPWVYPIGAVAPMGLADSLGPMLFPFLWFLLTTVLNGLSIAVLTDFGRKASGFTAAWWWLLVIFILSPVGLFRLEGIVAPIVIIALVLLARRPALAGVLLAVATWIKVWPVAVFLAVLGVGRQWLAVAAGGALITLGVVGAAIGLGGSPETLLSFVSDQSDRGLQLEAPISTPWVWMAALDRPGSYIFQNSALATREVAGEGAASAAAATTPLMLLAMALIFALLLRARRQETDAENLLVHGALALTCALVVFNKVGSPQYMLWIAPVVVVGLFHDAQRWRTPSYLVLVISVLTTFIFPVFYMPLAAGNIAAVLLLTVRNVLLVVLFAWSVWRLWRLATPPDSVPDGVASARSWGRLSRPGVPVPPTSGPHVSPGK
ncbi:glycosyltransferase 87 family protein [Microterricola pindariensis]|uniref:DUF2029 domain-containing protein n=1 Tax=Microterricola pindariensis TaxID=478010 RepID=A0ABX5AQN3_9MICO|nr:glycosyltransferase 87 family protein [Microterricola pindariensis]PPL14175.1 hypothetical protein GY24_16970 [Microterricola pindariensis]